MVLSLHHIIVSNDWMMVNNELEKICTAVLMAYFKVLYWHLPGQTEENLNQDSCCLDQYLNWAQPEHKSGLG